MLPNIPVVIAPSLMHLADSPALLKTTHAKVVDMSATGDPDAGVVGPPNSKRQNLLGNPEDTITSDDAEEKKTEAVDVGDDFDPQSHKVGIAGITFYASSQDKCLINDHYNLINLEPFPSMMAA